MARRMLEMTLSWERGLRPGGRELVVVDIAEEVGWKAITLR